MRGRRRANVAETGESKVAGGRLAVVVQPPLNVANSLLEEARRLACRLREVGGEVVWAAPQDYAVPLALLKEGGLDPDAGITVLVQETLRGVSEIAARLAQPELVDMPDDRALVVARMFGKNDEVSNLVKAVREGLEESGHKVDGDDPVGVQLASVEGAANIEAVRGCIENRDVPIAGWLLGGVYMAMVGDAGSGLLRVARTTFVPLRRIGSRRKSARSE